MMSGFFVLRAPLPSPACCSSFNPYLVRIPLSESGVIGISDIPTPNLKRGFSRFDARQARGLFSQFSKREIARRYFSNLIYPRPSFIAASTLGSSQNPEISKGHTYLDAKLGLREANTSDADIELIRRPGVRSERIRSWCPYKYGSLRGLPEQKYGHIDAVQQGEGLSQEYGVVLVLLLSEKMSAPTRLFAGMIRI